MKESLWSMEAGILSFGRGTAPSEPRRSGVSFEVKIVYRGVFWNAQCTILIV